jgi:preprotein translocase subunit SecE
MSSKSKRKHAHKGYNRANTGTSAEVLKERKDAEAKVVETAAADGAAEPAITETILTPKEFRKMEIQRAKQAKLAKKQDKEHTKKDKDKKGKDKPKKEKRNIFAEMGSELKKVHWPTWEEAWKATGIVLGVTVIFGLVVLGLDRLLGWLYEMLIGGKK